MKPVATISAVITILILTVLLFGLIDMNNRGEIADGWSSDILK